MKSSKGKAKPMSLCEQADEICDWVGEDDDFEAWLNAIGHEDYVNVEYLMAQFGVEPELAEEMLSILSGFLEEGG